MMNNILPIFGIFGILCIGASADFATIEDTSPLELADLTLEERHKLMLQKLAKKDDKILTDSFLYEILSTSIGNEFFGFSQNESITDENSAIIRAMVECLKKLSIQDRVEDLLFKVSSNGPHYLRTSGSFSAAFSLVCSDVDFFLKNETYYTTLRDMYEKQSHLSPNKIYHYELAKSPEDESKSIEELLNDPKLKSSMVHLAWVWISHSYNSKLKATKNSIVRLARVPDIAEEVQTIYEQLIQEVTPLIEHIDFYLFQTPGAIKEYFQYQQQNLTETLWNKITEDIPDWADYVECDILDTKDDTSSNRMRGTRCERGHLKEQDSIYIDAWPVTSDFNSFDLQNQTQEEQHTLFLRELVKKNSTQIYKLLVLELLAKSLGNDFFGFVNDAKSNIRINAIVKSVFDCIPNLLLQTKTKDILDMTLKNVSEYIAENGNVEEGFIQLCSNIDDLLQNETFYTIKRDEHSKQILLPKKTYQYGIGKPTEDQRKVMKDLFNDPALKKFWAHEFWINANFTSTTLAEGKTKYSILQMATIPSKSEAVQRIYDQSIEDSIHLIQNFTSDEIYVGVSTSEPVAVNPKSSDVFQFQTHLIRQIISYVKQKRDLSTIFNTLQKFLSHKGDKAYSYQP